MTYGHFENGTLVSTCEREHWMVNGLPVQGVPIADRPPGRQMWVGGESGSWQPAPLSPDEQLTAARSAAAALFASLTIEQQSRYLELYTGIERALDFGRVQVALHRLQTAPLDPADEPMRAQFLALFGR